MYILIRRKFPAASGFCRNRPVPDRSRCHFAGQQLRRYQPGRPAGGRGSAVLFLPCGGEREVRQGRRYLPAEHDPAVHLRLHCTGGGTSDGRAAPGLSLGDFSGPLYLAVVSTVLPTCAVSMGRSMCGRQPARSFFRFERACLAVSAPSSCWGRRSVCVSWSARSLSCCPSL